MSEVHARLETAYRRALKGRELMPGAEAHLQTAIAGLVMLAQRKAPPVRVEQFRAIGRKAARQELDALAELADRLAVRVEALHAPAIDALGELGVMRGPVTSWARGVSAAARAADVSRKPAAAGRGRPRNNLAILAAANVISDFERLTGARAALPADTALGARGLVPLVRAVFAVLHIHGDAKAAVEAALSERAKNSRAERY